MPIQTPYTEVARGQSYTVKRDVGDSRRKPTPENIHYHLGQLGYSQYSVNEVATWAATTPDSRARQLFDLQGLLEIEPELARAFLRDRGQDPRQEPTDRLSVDAVHKAVCRLSGQKIAVSRVQEWADLPGFGRPFFSQYFPSSALDKVAASTALAFMRHAKIDRKA